ncbi:MAG TPA: O-antigen ligase family protein [Gemmatimonadales bacterium]|nr:O-antigen ligase family protein [Gemmatimonadales bacterium]
MTATLSGPTVAGPRLAQRTWTPTYVLFLVYLFTIVTGRLPVGTYAMILALSSLIVQREPLRVPSFVWLFAAWFAWDVLGYGVTRYPDLVWDALVNHGKVLLVALLAANALRTGAQIRFFIVFVLMSYVLFPARSTFVNYVHGYTLFGRAVGPFIYGNPNDLAAHSILLLGPALALWASARHGGPFRWIGLGGAGLLTVLILLTQSRGAFLALGTMAMPSTLALIRRRPRAVLAVVAFLGTALYFAPKSFWARMQGLSKATSVATIGQMDPEGSARQRFTVLQTAKRIIEDHPVLGVGLGAYEVAQYHYNPSLGYLDTHNTYLNVLAETGLPGLVLFLAIVINVLRTVSEARRRIGHVLPAQAEMLRWLQYALSGYLIAAVFGSFAKLAFLYVYLALLWCAARAAYLQDLPVGQSEPLLQRDQLPIAPEPLHGWGSMSPQAPGPPASPRPGSPA